ncbi:MAG: M56 family metallopeptidase [Silvibacterium sp.]|nr:M56 family metallopeptidase [Silvibacterium sp.]MBV8437436.1 M56 family metallopeptidase [Silvibacterium sp.]
MTPDLMQSIERVAQVAASAFVSSLWQGVLLAAAVALCLRLMPRMMAAVRFAVWSAVFVVILLLPFAQMGGSHGVTSAGSGATFQVDVRWSYLILAAWAALSLVRGAKLAASAWRLGQLWRRSTPVPTILPPVKASSLFGSGFGSRRIEICTSTEIDRPSVIGFFAPRILIPEWLFEKLTPAELEQIVMHEFGHISRADDWINLFQKIGLVLFPLNPALMWIDRRLCFERELACDDGVLERTQAPGVYATCLVSLAERSKNRRAATLSLGAWERQSELGLRVESILRGGNRMSSRRAKVAAGAIGVALLGVAAGLSRLPHFISFSEGTTPGAVAERPILMPPSVAVPDSPPQHRPAMYRSGGTAHETLLKATMPAAVQPTHTPRHKKAAAGHIPSAALKSIPANSIPAVERMKQAPAGTQRWVVLTSFSISSAGVPADASVRPAISVHPGMMLTVDGEHAIAAVPTGDGWLIIQL